MAKLIAIRNHQKMTESVANRELIAGQNVNLQLKLLSGRLDTVLPLFVDQGNFLFCAFGLVDILCISY